MSDLSVSDLSDLIAPSAAGALVAPAVSGAVAGLGVAMPMGAMSVLLLQEAMRSRRAAAAAAAGIAVVDLGYAALATALGPWVAAHVGPVEAWVRLAAAAVLLAIAARGLRATREPAPPATGTVPGGSGGRAGAAFARYVGLTAVNPTTALYFAALTTAQGASLRSGAAGAAFLTGVGLASLLWQQLLVVVGSLAASRISDAVRVRTFRLGYGLVAAYALTIAFPLP
ncbi:LysE family transporter [Streptomyces sp. NPDC051130]|uniref:LysE family transporter n=1 Tax=Streptomyces sp. NPDC051130 TaxID=3157223 RepID=UPI00341323B8